MSSLEGLKISVSRKLCEWGPLGSWEEREYMLSVGDFGLVGLLDDNKGWSAIIPYSRYEELLEKEFVLEELDK